MNNNLLPNNPELPSNTPQTKYIPNTGISLEAELNKIASQSNPSPLNRSVSFSEIPQNGRYSIYFPGMDNEDIYGQNQTTPSKFGNAAVKFGGLAATTFIGGTAGLVNGIGQWIATGNFSSLYNNDFNKDLDQFNKEQENAFANYYTNQEANAEWYSPDNWFTANFFADKIFKNLGFAAGAALSGTAYSAAIRGSMSLLSKAIPQAAKLMTTGGAAEVAAVTEEALATAGQGKKAGAILKGFKDVATKYNAQYKILDKGHRAVVSALATAGEASVEALQMSQGLKDRKIKEYYEQTGQIPTEEVLKQIEQQAAKAGNTLFLMNTALLTATNYIQFPKILGGSFSKSKRMASLPTSEVVKNAEGQYIKQTTKFGKLLDKVAPYARTVFSPSEGFEEFSQTAYSMGVDKYFSRKNEESDSNILKDALGIIADGYSQAASSKEGLESALIGALSGGLFEYAGGVAKGQFKPEAFKERAEKEKNTNDLLNSLNTTYAKSYLKDTINSLKTAASIAKDQTSAVQAGDKLTARNLEHDYMLNYALPRVKYGKSNLIYEELDQLSQLASTEEGLEQLKADGLIDPTDTAEKVQKRISTLKTMTKTLDEQYDMLQMRLAPLTNKKGEKIYTDEVIDKMLYASSKADDYTSRINELTASVSSVPLLSAFTEIDSTGKLSKETVAAIEQTIKSNFSGIKQDEVKAKVQDAIELYLQRKQIINEYNTIKNNPEKHQEIDYTNIEIDEEEDSITVNDKTYSKNTFYRTGSELFSKDEKGNLQFLPGFKIKGKNLFNDITLEDQSGNVKAVSLPLLSDNLKELTEKERASLESFMEQHLSKQFASIEGFKDLSLQEKLDYINQNNLQDQVLSSDFVKDLQEWETRKDKLQKEKTLSNTSQDIPETPTPEQTAKNLEPLDPAKDIRFGFFTSNTPNIYTTDAESNSVMINENNYWYRRFNKTIFNMSRTNWTGKGPNGETITANMVKVLPITYNNQAAVGFSSLIAPDYKSGSETISNTDPTRGRVILAFVVELPSGIYFLGQDGNTISKIGDNNDGIKNQLVYSNLETARYQRENGREAGENKFTNRKAGYTPEQQEELKQHFLQYRTGLLTSTNILAPIPFSISAGLPNVKDKNSVTSPIEAGIITETDLESPTLIQIPISSAGEKTGKINSGGQTINAPVGIPFLTNSNEILPLRNRKFTEAEANNIFNILSKLVEDAIAGIPANSQALTYLQSITLWNKEITSRNQVFLDTEFLYVGGKKFPAHELKANKQEILNLLKEAYYNVNNRTLKSNTRVSSVTVKDNQFVVDPAQSYNAFLLTGNNPPLHINTIIPQTEWETPLIAKYTILQVPEIQFIPKEVKKQEEQKPPVQQPSATTSAKKVKYKDNIFTLDNITPNTIPTKKGPLVFTATESAAINEDDQLVGTVTILSESAADFKQQDEDGMVIGELIVRKILSESTPFTEQATPTQFTPTTPDNTETKIADIERRREEVRSIFETNPILALHIIQKEKRIGSYDDYGRPNGKVQDIVSVLKVSVSKAQELLQDYLKAGKPQGWKFGDDYDYSKYDAEYVDAVKKGEMIKEQAMQALEQVGRKDSDAYRELSALGQQPTAPQQPTADPKPDTSTVSKTEQKENKINILKEKIRKHIPGNNEGLKRIVLAPAKLIENTPAFKRWMQENLPQVPVHVMDRLIQMTDGGKAWGKYENQAIYLYNAAEKGTGYHEAFHAVFNLFLTEEEQDKLFKEFRNRKSTFTDRETGKTIAYKSANNHQIEEQLAEEFREYQLGKENPKTKNFFQKLLEWIKSLFIDNKAQALFEKIGNKGFSTSTPIRTFASSKYSIAFNKENIQFKKDVLDGMTYYFFLELDGMDGGISNLNDQKVDVVSLYDNIKEKVTGSIENNFLTELQEYAKSEGLSVEEVAEQRYERYDEIEQKVQYINENWDYFRKEHEKFLRPLNIVFEELTDDEGNPIEKEENKNNREYSPNPLSLDAKKTATPQVKLVFSTLAKREFTKIFNPDSLLPGTKLVYNNSYLPTLAPVGSTFYKVLSNLADTTGVSKIKEKLKQLGKAYPDLTSLYYRIFPKEDTSTYTKEEWNLVQMFYGAMNKQTPTYYQMKMAKVEDVIDTEEGAEKLTGQEVYFIDTNYNTQTRQLIEEWLSLLANSNKTVERNNLTLLKTESITSDPLAQFPATQIKFLKELHFPFTENDFNRIPKYKRQEFNTALSSLYVLLKKRSEVPVNEKAMDASSHIRTIAQIISQAKETEVSATHTGIDGEQRQRYILPSSLSFILNRLNEANTKEEFLANNPHFQDVFHQHSQIIEKYFKDKRFNPDLKLNLGVIEGTTAEDQVSSTISQSLGFRRLQEFNANLEGIYYTLIPADATTEWGINTGYYLPVETFSEGRFMDALSDVFKGYLEDEINLMNDFENRKHIAALNKYGKELRFFKYILSEELQKKIKENQQDFETFYVSIEQELKQEIAAHLNQLTQNQLKDFLAEGIISFYPDTNTYSFHGLNTSFLKKYQRATGVKIDAKKLSDKEIKQIIGFRLANYFVNNIEMHKLFFSDPAQIKDGPKRWKSWLSGREATDPGNDGYNDFLFKNWNLVDDVPLASTDPGFSTPKTYFNSLTFLHGDKEEAVVSPYYEEYKEAIGEAAAVYEKIDEIDAQSYRRDVSVREFMLKSSGRWTPEMEEMHQILMAKSRLMMEEDGVYKYSNQNLKKKDKELSKKNHDSSLYVTKPITAGPRMSMGEFISELKKTSELPLYYALIGQKTENKQHKHPNLVELYKFMYKNNIDHMGPTTQHKVGTPTYTPTLYDKQGNFALSSLTPEQIQQASSKNLWEYTGIQVETSGKHSTVTLGTQPTKLGTMDLYENGKVINPEHQALVEQHEESLSNLAAHNFTELLDKIGITKENNSYVLSDPQKLISLLKDEVARREMPADMLEALDIVFNPDLNLYQLKTPLEALPNFMGLKQIIWANADKAISRPKMNGAPYVQVSAAMWETNKRQAVYKKDGKWTEVPKEAKLSEDKKSLVYKDTIIPLSDIRLSSSDLAYYSKGKDGKTTYCEILLPNHFAEKLRKAGIRKTDEEILSYLNETEEGRKLLTGVGFRIPFQGLNSAEVFVIKGFLPKEFGDTVVVPSEITAKAGSDFDIDKLNIYLKNFYIDGNNNIKFVKYFANREEHDAFYKQEFLTILANRFKTTEQKIQNNQYLEAHLLRVSLGTYKSTNASSVENEEFVKKWKSIFLEMFPEAKDANEIAETLKRRIEKNQKRFESLNNQELQVDLMWQFIDEKYKQSLQNRYYETLEELIRLPENFERLITPNSSKEMTDLDEELNEGANKITIGDYLDPLRMSEERYNFIVGKNGIGIAAVAQTGNSMFQKTRVEMQKDPSLLDPLQDEDKAINRYGTKENPNHDWEVKLKNKGTFSNRTDVEGRLISDKISQYINGFVDVAKDAWVTRLGINNLTAPIYLFLERMGVSTRDTIYFMNQPIIKDFLKEKEINRLALSLGTEKYKSDEQIYSSVLKKYPSEVKDWYADTFSTKQLKSMFEKRKKGEQFNQEENDLQRHILTEFMKYQVFARHLFDFTQAINWDTTRINSNHIVRDKIVHENKVRTANLFGNPDRVLEKSFIAEVREKTINFEQAYSSISQLSHPKALQALSPVYEALSKTINKTEERHKAMQKADLSFIEYIAHTTNTYLDKKSGEQKPLSWFITNMLFHKQFNVADEVQKAQTKSDNYALKALMTTAQQTLKDSKNIKLRDKLHGTLEADMFTTALRQLKQESPSLYADLVLLGMLQSGLKYSPISFNRFIPHEDWAAYIEPALNLIKDLSQEQIEHFKTSFFRNHWKDNNIVPSHRGKIYEEKGVKHIFINPKNKKGRNEVVKVKDTAINPSTDKPYTKQEISKMKKEGDYSYLTTRLFQKVYKDGQPVITKEGYFIYKEINPWGNGMFGQEYHAQPQFSSFPSNNRANEKPDSFFHSLAYSSLEEQKEDPTPTSIPTKPVEQPLTNSKGEIIKNNSKFTYEEKTIETDFPLTDSQTKALKSLIDFSNSKENFITLQGPAGTGKTSIIGYLQKYLVGSHNFIYMAPTHAATAELAFATIKVGNKSLPMTVASSLKHSFNGDVSFSRKFIDRLGLGINIIVLDEVSMLSSKDYEKLKEVTTRNNIKIIFMGDVKQIPEVNTNNLEKKLVSKAFTEHKQISLTEVKRTNSGAILSMLENIRNNPNGKIPVVSTDKQLLYAQTITDFNTQLKKALDSNLEETVVISYTNDGVQSYNQKIRKALGKEEDTKEGDVIVGYLGYATKQIEKQSIANSIRYTIEKIERNKKNPSVINITASSKKLNYLRQAGLKISNIGATSYYQLSTKDALTFSELTQEDFDLNNKLISEYFRTLYDLKAEAIESGKKSNWAGFYSQLEYVTGIFSNIDLGSDYVYNPKTDKMEPYNFNRHSELLKNYPELKIEKGVDFGYAVTIHKSQGSTVKNVFFDASSLPKYSTSKLIMNGRQIGTEKDALLYVGVSRASNVLVINAENKENFYSVIEEQTTSTLNIEIVDLFNKYKKQILSKDKTYTLQDFIKLSSEEREQLISCL